MYCNPTSLNFSASFSLFFCDKLCLVSSEKLGFSMSAGVFITVTNNCLNSSISNISSLQVNELFEISFSNLFLLKCFYFLHIILVSFCFGMWDFISVHCVKSVRIRSYSGPHFPAFGLNTERYRVSLRILSECEKMPTRITPNTNTFYAVVAMRLWEWESPVSVKNVFQNCWRYWREKDTHDGCNGFL